MVKKKRGRIQMLLSKRVSNRLSYTIISVAILIALGVFVYAQTAPNPGHSFAEISPGGLSCETDQFLQYKGVNLLGGPIWDCVDISTNGSGGGTDTRCDASGVCSQVCIGSDCRNVWPSGGGGVSAPTISGPFATSTQTGPGVTTTNLGVHDMCTLKRCRIGDVDATNGAVTCDVQLTAGVGSAWEIRVTVVTDTDAIGQAEAYCFDF